MKPKLCVKPLKDYLLLDSGGQEKLERFGDYVIARPCQQAVWKKSLSKKIWDDADATFTRKPNNEWSFKRKLPDKWQVIIEGIQVQLSATDFGHLGIFPEHASHWRWMQNIINKNSNVLNLFAYSGGTSLVAAKAGANVCHVDSSKGMVDWARENAALNDLEKAPIRWIVDDVISFLKREIRRKSYYDAIILDPPTFGRGRRREVFKIEKDLLPLLSLCRELLKEPSFVLFSCHTPGLSPLVMKHLMSQTMGKMGNVEAGEMKLLGQDNVLPLPSGTYARWKK